jgi:hypothetical protein
MQECVELWDAMRTAVVASRLPAAPPADIATCIHYFCEAKKRITAVFQI